MHLWPTWEKEVHDILQPLFKELQLIFLAYTRSISEDSAEDAMEMSMDEFHDFVVDVGLETKDYKFDVMCNQFIKANATNTAQARAHRSGRPSRSAMRSRARLRAKLSPDARSAEPRKVEKVKGDVRRQGGGAKDQELVLYEFLNMLVRIAFWRANPQALGCGSTRTATAKMDKDARGRMRPCRCRSRSPRCSTSSCCRARSARTRRPSARRRCASAVRNAASRWPPKLKQWYTDLQKSSLSVGQRRQARLRRVARALRLPHEPNGQRRAPTCAGEEVEQLSEITGDPSTQARTSSAASRWRRARRPSWTRSASSSSASARPAENSEQTVLGFDEFCECIARCSASPSTRPVKQMDNGQKIVASFQNLSARRAEEDVHASEATTMQGGALRHLAPAAQREPEDHGAFLDLARCGSTASTASRCGRRRCTTCCTSTLPRARVHLPRLLQVARRDPHPHEQAEPRRRPGRSASIGAHDVARGVGGTMSFP